jgi:hypothetical protein
MKKLLDACKVLSESKFNVPDSVGSSCNLQKMRLKADVNLMKEKS